LQPATVMIMINTGRIFFILLKIPKNFGDTKT